MKLNSITTIITFGICTLIAYAFYNYSPIETKTMLTIGSFLFLLVSGLGFLSVSFKQSRTTTNIKTISGIFFFIGLALSIVSSVFAFKEPTYIITLGLIFLVYILIAYSITNQQQ
ncbi:MAG: hypothetical protein RLZZ540_740 [Bacteroidota bacterium]|jgi:magnesium-transporting ATPase (P-type)